MKTLHPFKKEVSLIFFFFNWAELLLQIELCPTETEALFQKQTVKKKKVFNVTIAWVDLF